MTALKTLISLFTIYSLVWSSIASASISSGEKLARPERLPISVNRVAVFENGQAICAADLNENPSLAPKIMKIAPNSSSIEGLAYPERNSEMDALPACDGQKLGMIAQVAALANNGNQTAALPLLIIPALVCIVAGGFGGYVTTEAMKGLYPADVLGWTYVASGAGAAAVITGSGALPLPAAYAAGYGGLIGAGCSIVGSMLGMVYYIKWMPR